MSYFFEDFLAKEPYQFHLSLFDDKGKERGVFSARWKSEDFSSLLDFQVFLFRYSGLLQPYISELRGESLQPFFQVEAGSDQAAKTFHSTHKEIQADAATWCSQKLSFADFSWLQPGDHTSVMEFLIDGFPEMIARGPSGYLTIFVADTLSK